MFLAAPCGAFSYAPAHFARITSSRPTASAPCHTRAECGELDKTCMVARSKHDTKHPCLSTRKQPAVSITHWFMAEPKIKLQGATSNLRSYLIQGIDRQVGMGSAGSLRRQTFLEYAAAADLDQAELQLKLKRIKRELQSINRNLVATFRRRKKLINLQGPTKDADEKERASDEAKMLCAFSGSIHAVCTAEEYDMEIAFRRLRVWSRGQAKFMESATVVHVRTGLRDDENEHEALEVAQAPGSSVPAEGDVFVFPYGVVVCWNLTEVQLLEIQTVMRLCQQRGYTEPGQDRFSYTYGDAFDMANQDHLILTTSPSNNITTLERSVLEKLAASHAFAQSLHLEQLAKSVQSSIGDTWQLAAELAATGTFVSQRRKDIARTTGRLICDRYSIYMYAADRHSIHLFADQSPEVCWERPELDPLFRLVAKYLQLAPRVVLLNARMELVRKLLVVVLCELENVRQRRRQGVSMLVSTIQVCYCLSAKVCLRVVLLVLSLSATLFRAWVFYLQ